MTRKIGVRRTSGKFMLALAVATLFVAPGGTAGATDDLDHVNVDAPVASVTFSVPVNIPSVGEFTGPFSICVGPTCVTQAPLPSGQAAGHLHVTLLGDGVDTVNIDVDQVGCPVGQEGVGLSLVSSADVIESVRAEFVPTGQPGQGVQQTNPAGAFRNATAAVCTDGG